MRSLAALSVIAASLGSGLMAEASCAPPDPVAQRVERADAVVWGTVVGDGGGLLSDRRSLRVRVQTVYKGSVPAQVTVRMGPEIPNPGPGQVGVTSVDYAAAPGSSHTLYLKQHAPDGFSTDACSGSHEGEPTTEETTVLGAPRVPERGPGVPGSTTDLDRALAAGAIGAVLAATYLSFRAASALERFPGRRP
ncbi:MAG: hypothetical protein ACR2G8_08120 [Candidatus Limnocylindria bacterium]